MPTGVSEINDVGFHHADQKSKPVGFKFFSDEESFHRKYFKTEHQLQRLKLVRSHRPVPTKEECIAVLCLLQSPLRVQEK